MANAPHAGIRARDFVSYALAHNGIPVVSEISVQGLDPAVSPVSIQVDVLDRDTVVTVPWTINAEVSDDGTVELSALEVRLDPGQMAKIEERRPGTLRVIVSAHGEVLAQHSSSVNLLAARQWLVDLSNPVTSYELLAAHVMPNDPALALIASEARVRLEKTTGSSSTEGYQSGPERVDEIVGAVYEALRAREIAYSNPPASWTDVGQKVRTPSDVIEGRVGTCLDTTVVLAAALEHVGINSMLIVVEGHAFLAYAREEMSQPLVADTDLSTLRTMIDVGLVRVVETVLLTSRGDDGAFDSPGHRGPYNRYLTDDLSRADASIDVLAARRTGILPLPALHRGEDGTIHVVPYVPTEHSGVFRALSAAEKSSPAAGESKPVPDRVRRWKNSLLDLSLRNRLVNFSARGAVSLAVADSALVHIENRLNAGKPIGLIPADQVANVHKSQGVRFGAQLPQSELARVFDDQNILFTDISSESYVSRLRNLAYKARTIEEESGANNLYVALGSLHWKIDGKALKSPLILVPVKLVVGRGSTYRVVLDESGASTPNYCLVEKLRQVHGLRIPTFENPPEDDHGIDLAAVIHAVRSAIVENGLNFHVEETADLAILQFAKFRLWKDMDENWDAFMQNALVKHLVESPTDPFEDPAGEDLEADLDELDALCPIPADSSQLEAIAAAVTGQSFVLEGPPGTGKSQTITNLLTRAVAEGKRVLFVAEKRAALDVVSNRLDSVGLGVFSLDLHDKGAKPTVVREQIRRALDHAVFVDSQGLAARRDELAQARKALARYADRLHDENPAGLSFYSARTQRLALADSTYPMPVPPAWVAATDPDTVVTIRDGLSTLADVADPARPRRRHPWGFIRHSLPQGVDVSSVAAAVQEVDAAAAQLPPTGAVAAFIGAADNSARVRAVASFVAAPPIGLIQLDAVRTGSWQDAKDTYLRSLKRWVAVPPPGLENISTVVLDLPLAQIRADVAAAASSGFVGRKKRIVAAFAPIAGLLTPQAKVKPKEALEFVGRLLQIRADADELAPGQSGVAGLRTPEGWNPFSDTSRDHVTWQIQWLEWGAEVVNVERASPDDSTFIDAARAFVSADVRVSPEEREAVERFESASTALWDLLGSSEGDIEHWLDRGRLSQVWFETAEGRGVNHALSLDRWLAFLAQLAGLRAAGLDAAVEELIDGAIGADTAVRAFDLGIADASIQERRETTGLDAFDAEAHGKAIGRFSSSMAVVRGHLRTSVPSEILDARPFDPASARGQVGALQRELNKQRGGLKVRALLDKYGDLITQIMPCVLVSPDSVARFFPVGSQTFDLVVFDEASQIRVADAIGAMGRATSVVVVGDSKQMPPTSVAESTVQDDDDAVGAEFSVEDEESILTEVVQARARQRWLSWHYRSQDESLIAFSNVHYYENKLSSFPAPVPEHSEEFGVRLVRAGGEFLRTATGKLKRTNPTEAEAIVAEIKRRFADSPEKLPSIGVVTFNQEQRTLIESMLRDLQDDRILEALDGTNGEGLFVKNLENVQGDERDVILFSVAFSKVTTSARTYLPLNFGPLNRAGGERRLNVAVTRARRLVVLFCSFEPSDLRADDTQSVGIKHLRAYLDMADRGAESMSGSASRAGTVDRHRDDIANALRERGLLVRTDLGLSDFKIDIAIMNPENPSEPVVAVLLDTPGWASRRTVGDRDGLPVTVLGGLMGWRAIERVWLPEWLQDQEVILDRLASAARSPRTDASAADVLPPATPSLESSSGFAGRGEPSVPRPGPQRRALPGAETFEEWTVGSVLDRRTLDDLPDPVARRKVTDVMTDIVAAEGPVSVDRLVRLSAAKFGLTRLSAARIASIEACVPKDGARVESGFVWPSRVSPMMWSSFRTADSSSPRTVADVSPWEIGNAMVALCRDAFGMSEDELYSETLALFGWKRRTEGTLAPLRSALETALKSGRLVKDDSNLVNVGQ